jgi:MGT family glycosyltransferase
MPGVRPGRFLFVTWDGGGNVTPFIGLGAQLRDRGHAVRVLAGPSLESRMTGIGLDFTPQRSSGWLPDASDVLAAVAATRPDALLVDFMLPSALSAAESTGLPTAALVHTLYAPVADNSFPAIEMEGPVDGLNATRTDLALSPVERVVDVLDHVQRIIAVTTAAFDGPAAVLHAHARHVGPVLEDAGDDTAWTPPWPADDERPLVVVSMGTTPMDQQPVLQRAAHALADLPVRALVQLPPHLDGPQVDLPANAAVSGYVRHAAVLPHASLVVTHAGLGTVSAALAFGVPMVCLPLGRDQPLTAARVEAVGAGRTLAPAASVATVRAAIADVLDDGRYRAAAERLGTEIQAGINEERARHEVESLLGGP